MTSSTCTLITSNGLKLGFPSFLVYLIGYFHCSTFHELERIFSNIRIMAENIKNWVNEPDEEIVVKVGVYKVYNNK